MGATWIASGTAEVWAEKQCWRLWDYGGKRACTTRSGLRVDSSVKACSECVLGSNGPLLVSYNLCPIKEKCFAHASGIQGVSLRAVKRHGH